MMDTDQAFRDDLKERALTKRKLAFEAFKKKKALERKAKTKPNVLQDILDRLQALKELIVSRGTDKGTVKFKVTERDIMGEVKSFEVEP